MRDNRLRAEKVYDLKGKRQQQSIITDYGSFTSSSEWNENDMMRAEDNADVLSLSTCLWARTRNTFSLTIECNFICSYLLLSMNGSGNGPNTSPPLNDDCVTIKKCWLTNDSLSSADKTWIYHVTRFSSPTRKLLVFMSSFSI